MAAGWVLAGAPGVPLWIGELASPAWGDVSRTGVGAGASPQTVTSVLTYEPLQKVGLTFADVDKFSPELHNPEITLPAGAGDVPTANFKMIAALAVMKKAIEKAEAKHITPDADTDVED